MRRPTRRRVLTAGAALTAALAGCSGRDPTETGPPAGTPTETPTDTATETREEPTETPPPYLRWAASIEGEPEDVAIFPEGQLVAGDPRVHDGRVYVGSTAGALHAFDAATGAEDWRFDAPNPVFTNAFGGEWATVDGDLYALSGTADGIGHGFEFRLHALDPATGEEGWTHDFDTGYASFGILGIADDAVVVGSNDDALSDEEDVTVAVDRGGGERWRVETGDVSDGALADGVAYVTAQSRLYALDLASGEERWREEVETWGLLRVAADGENVYFRHEEDGDPVLRALDPATGEQRWRLDWRADPITLADALYVGGEHLARLEPDGTERWRREEAGEVGPVDDGVAYAVVGSDVVALAADDGTEVWRTTLDAEDLRPLVLGEDALVVDADDAFVALDRAGGDRRWEWDPYARRRYGPATGDGAAFLATDRGRVLARDL